MVKRMNVKWKLDSCECSMLTSWISLTEHELIYGEHYSILIEYITTKHSHCNDDLPAGDFWPGLEGYINAPCFVCLLLQSLFHLSVFRRLVLNYHLSERLLEKCKSHSVSKLLCIPFAQTTVCYSVADIPTSQSFVFTFSFLQIILS